MDDSEKLLAGLNRILDSFSETERHVDYVKKQIRIKLHDMVPDRYREVLAFKEKFEADRATMTKTKMIESYSVGGIKYVRSSIRNHDTDAGLRVTVAKVDGIEKVTISDHTMDCCLTCVLAKSYLEAYDSHENYLQSIAASNTPSDPKSPWAKKRG